MTDFSETFRPIKAEYDDSPQFTSPELIHTTAGARLFRVRKAGKFFILKTPKNNGGMFLDLLIREYELSIGFSHPHIINVFTYESHTPVGPAIVMEYVDGRTLADYLKENPSQTARIRVFEQLLSAVSCLHKADIIHNDLKPQNILITRSNDDVKLIDFGLSDNSTHYTLKQLGGTPRYASPELLAREGTDTRSDIYSIGCIMRDLFGNRYRRILKKCLQSRKEDRYDNVEELMSVWKHRHRPQRMALGLLTAVILLLPSALYIKEHIKLVQMERTNDIQAYQHDSITTSLQNKISSTQEAILQQRRTVDSISNLYDTNLQKAYDQTEQTLKSIPYREFAFVPVPKFYRYSWELGDSYANNIKDPSIHTQLTSHFDALRNRMQQQLYDIVNQKPTMDAKQMSKDEYQYYLDLLSEQKPFKPYQP